MAVALRIEDYALIGDCQTAALVGRDGSIDWLCLPRFDSGACFAALLGSPENGRWKIAPNAEVRSVHRQYQGGTMVLETEFETAEGRVAVVDCMPVRTDEPNLVRWIVGRAGTVKMGMELILRTDYGSIVPWVRRTSDGISAVAGPESLRIRTPVEMHGKDFRTVAEFSVSADQHIPFVLQWHPSHKPAPQPIDAAQAVTDTKSWWETWSSRFQFEGPWREIVLRSLLTLKALTYAPTGGVVAAATTSLPELIGGVRNWDYRYCWLRDATFTLYALLTSGFTDEAVAWREWLMRAVAGNPAQLNSLYGLAGERRLTEWVLDWLAGYENSRPVRIGNAAERQIQLDVVGELIDTLHLTRRYGIAEDENVWRIQRVFVEHLAQIWRKPDQGIWETRGEERDFTHSKIMAWVAFDRSIKAVERYGLQGPVARWREIRQQIHDEVCQHGFNQRKNSFVQAFDSDALDASLLMIPLVGFLPPSDPRMVGTVAAIRRELTQDGFVLRYRTQTGVDGLPPGEGTFLPCTFWLADNLSLQGKHNEAETIFKHLLSLCNDVGLLSEEFDPHAKRLLGNFPQAFSHVCLINTAYNLSGPWRPAEHRSQA